MTHLRGKLHIIWTPRLKCNKIEYWQSLTLRWAPLQKFTNKCYMLTQNQNVYNFVKGGTKKQEIKTSSEKKTISCGHALQQDHCLIQQCNGTHVYPGGYHWSRLRLHLNKMIWIIWSFWLCCVPGALGVTISVCLSDKLSKAHNSSSFSQSVSLLLKLSLIL